MRPHDLKPFVVHRAAERFGTPATWDSCSLEDLLAEPTSPKAPGPWLASVYQRLVVAASGPVAVGKTSARLDAASWFHAALGADLDAARKACWPALEACQALAIGVGSLAPKLVLVGESTETGLPFHSVSGGLLWRALRLHGWDELACYVTNALGRRGGREPRNRQLKELFAAFEKYAPTWVALGQRASAVLGGAGIAHVLVDGPAYWYKIRAAEGPGGYANHLLAQGLQRGPWFGQKLPSVALDGEQVGDSLLAARLGLPISVAPRSVGQKTRGSSKPSMADAHRYFVTGIGPKGEKIETLADAAKAAGSNGKYTHDVARREHWPAEREAQQKKTLEKAKEKASDVEAQKIATCRALAWTATALGLGSVVRRLQNPEGDLAKEIDPRQVLALGKIALGVSQLGDPKTSDELQRVQQLSAQELLTKYKEVLGAFGVEEERAP